MKRPGATAVAAVLFAATACMASASETSSDDAIPVATVTVIGTGVSNMDAASSGDVTHEELASQPLLRPAAVLENVPGLIVTQHSGEGKANQYFLRAFNLDHGTDLATEVDGMPINLPTHAHGQGYTDLNFLIPELIGDLHFKKGPYYADEGDFATAGAIRMTLLNAIPASATLGFGQDGYRRALLLGSAPLADGTLLGAADLYHNDGPFNRPDDYNRLNAVVPNIFSPKLGIVLGPWHTTSLYITVADGYHSNDARGVTRNGTNPDAPPVTPLTRATSSELGLATNPTSNWHTTFDLFLLKLKSELVFDGDAGATEPSGPTTRTGVEWGNTLQISSWLRAALNAAFSRARFDHDVTGRYIPNSPTNVIDLGLTAQHPSGWFGTLKARHFGESPLTQDNSAKSPAYTTVDLQLGYQRPGDWLLAVDVFNVANVKWNDIEYYYVSRLQNEAAPRPDFVVHPGVPRTFRAQLQYWL